MIINPHGLDIKWQVLLINLYCHIMVVDVRAGSPLCCAERRGLSLRRGREDRTHRTHQMSTFYTLCPAPGSLFPCKPLSSSRGWIPELCLCLGYKTQIVSGEKGSDLLINISAQPLLEQMENVKFALCSAELGDSPLDHGWSSGSSVEG